MRLRVSPRRRRAGAAIVEMAAVLIVFVLFLFGYIEYCRYIFVRQVMENAAREAARYGAVRTFSTSFDADVKAVADTRMAGVQKQVNNYKVTLYKADTTGASTGSADAAEFGEYVVVQIDGDYSPVLPSLLFLNSTLPVRARALVNSEAN